MVRRDWSNRTGRHWQTFRLTLIVVLTLVAAVALSPAASKKAPARKPPAQARQKKQISQKSSKPAVSVAEVSQQVAVARWMASLSLRQKIAQLVVIPFNGHPFRPRSREAGKFMNLVTKEHIGGLILVNTANGRIVAKADPFLTADFLNRMQKLSKVPLLVAGDFERGA